MTKLHSSIFFYLKGDKADFGLQEVEVIEEEVITFGV